MKKILAPVDFSQNSINALYVAAEIARKSGAMLAMLHVNLNTIYSSPLSECCSLPPSKTTRAVCSTISPSGTNCSIL
ncbi:MAG: universal stress protein [Saprospiraceae bacterium]